MYFEIPVAGVHVHVLDFLTEFVFNSHKMHYISAIKLPETSSVIYIVVNLLKICSNLANRIFLLLPLICYWKAHSM